MIFGQCSWNLCNKIYFTETNVSIIPHQLAILISGQLTAVLNDGVVFKIVVAPTRNQQTPQ